MYDLPSEDPEEPGLPDEFHEFQPQLLRETFQPSDYPPENIFIGTDINLYYDSRHPLWYKRPDWFVVLGVPSAAEQKDLRLSYVIWQEGIAPFLVIELLSPGTENEDLGQNIRALPDRETPPGKWEVYERMLRIPYYAVFDRYTNHLKLFQLIATRYQEIPLTEQRYWFEEIQLGLGVWQGTYQRTAGLWLRWYDSRGIWLPTPVELAEQERQRADKNAKEQNASRNAYENWEKIQIKSKRSELWLQLAGWVCTVSDTNEVQQFSPHRNYTPRSSFVNIYEHNGVEYISSSRQ
jgi:Uma2 family endonuclease